MAIDPEARFKKVMAGKKAPEQESAPTPEVDASTSAATKKSTAAKRTTAKSTVTAAKAPAKRRRKVDGDPELANRVREWAKRYRVANDPYLVGITDAIENDENLAVWASTDVFQLMPYPEVRATESRLQQMMVLTRNILIFLPVGLTWLAISKATSAFALYTAKQSGSVANFLQFWQDGYGLLSKTWTISHVAILDFLIIVGVIVLTFVAPIMQQNSENRAVRENDRAERERIGLNVEIMTFLFDKKEVNTVTMSAALARSVQNLRTSTKALGDVAKRIEKIAKTLPNNAAIIQEIRKIGK